MFALLVPSLEWVKKDDFVGAQQSYLQENYSAVNAIFPAVRHYLFLQNVFKCRQKIVM